uniref:Macroglobulin domain-containing protein n=1 Tax=viral metagenome TaxID=1070528 RepID=A0A6M3J258_9ZZZZ
MYDIDIVLKETYIRGESVYADITIRLHSTGALATPATSITCTVYDSNKATVVSAAACTADSTGKYHYSFAPNQPSSYKLLIAATTTGSIVTIARKDFDVIALP